MVIEGMISIALTKQTTGKTQILRQKKLRNATK